MPDDQQLTKLTANLTPRAFQALEDAATITGDTKTDTINRALQIYLLFVGAVHIGERIWLGVTRWRSHEVTADWFNEGDGRRG